MLAELELREECGMETLQDRVEHIIDGLLFALRQGAAVEELRQGVAKALREAFQRERSGLHDTLRLCLAAFEESLKLDSISRPFRAVLRVCRVLCLEALEENSSSELTDTVYDRQSDEIPS